MYFNLCKATLNRKQNFVARFLQFSIFGRSELENAYGYNSPMGSFYRKVAHKVTLHADTGFNFFSKWTVLSESHIGP